MMKRKDKIVILLTGILFLLFFSYMTSPLFPWAYGWDSAFFQLVGAGMTKGYLPYRDFFDMKGPWLFLIEYLGELIWYGRTGIFLVQCVSFGITLLLCCRIYEKFFGGKGLIKSFLTLIPLYIVMASTMEGGNLTEEWSLPFLFFSLYLALNFVMGEEKEHNPWHALVYGICFGVLALIRVTNSVLICAIVLTVLIFLIAERRWINLLRNAAAFLAGMAVAFLIPVLYFGYFGEIKSMLYCTFVFGFVYGTEGFGFGTGMLFLITLWLSCGICLIAGMKNKRLWVLVISNTLGMMVTLGMGNSTLHDYMLVIPGMMLGIWLISENLEKGGANRKKRMAIALMLVCFAYPCYKAARTGISLIGQFSDKSAYDNVMETAACIPEEDRDFVLGYEVPLRWYTIADIMPCSKYCGWQEHYMKLSPRIESEIAQMFEETPPKWIVTKATAAIENAVVKPQIELFYTVYVENEDFILYKRN